MKVERIMTRNVVTCNQNDTLNTAAQLMRENDCGCVPVISADGSGAVVGMLTDRDICMAAYTQGKTLMQLPVTCAMAKKVITCKPTDDIRHAEALMRDNRIRRLPVVDDNGKLVGIVSLNDIAREAEAERRSGAKEISGPEVVETLAGICQPRGENVPAFRTTAFAA
jgi:CBS domain-containing protein